MFSVCPFCKGYYPWFEKPHVLNSVFLVHLYTTHGYTPEEVKDFIDSAFEKNGLAWNGASIKYV